MSCSHNHAHDGSAHTATLGSSESSTVSAAGNPRLREGGMYPGHQAAEEASWWEGCPTTAFPAARWKTRPRSRWASGDHQPSATRPTVLGKLRPREAAPGPTEESSRQRQGPRPGLRAVPRSPNPAGRPASHACKNWNTYMQPSVHCLRRTGSLERRGRRQNRWNSASFPRAGSQSVPYLCSPGQHGPGLVNGCCL